MFTQRLRLYGTGNRFIFFLSMKRQTLLPIAPCGKILQEAGADRVAYDAAEALEKVLTKLGLEIGELAWKLAKHSGRKTIKKGDVILAAEQKLP